MQRRQELIAADEKPNREIRERERIGAGLRQSEERYARAMDATESGPDAHGRTALMTGSAAEITEAKRVIEALRTSEQRYARAMEASDDGLWEYVVASGTLFASKRARQLWAVPDEADISTRADLRAHGGFHPEDLQRIDDAFRACVAGETERYDIEYRVVEGGKIRWVHSRGKIFSNLDGRPALVTGSVRDITGQRHAFEALRQSEERFALGVAGANEGIYDWDLVSDRAYLSQRAQDLFGLPPGELWRDRREWQQILRRYPADLNHLRSSLKAYLTGESPAYDVEYRAILPDGSVRWFRQRGIALRDASGKAYRMVGSVGDITDRKRAQEELLRLERQLRQGQRLEAMGTLAGGIAHDFNNILGAILGYGEIALRGVARGSRMRRDLDSIMAAGERGRALVERILAFSRSGVGERVAVHVEKVVSETLGLMSAKLPAGITIETQLRAARAAMLGDATQVHQVLMNLATNAVQAMPSGGTLRVSVNVVRLEEPRAVATGTVQAGKYVVLEVADDGTGMPAEVLERIFDPFFTTKETGVGTGLGLSLVHGIVGEVGGAVEVRSTVGEGSVFTVYLPRAGDAPEEDEEEEGELPRGDHQQVMVVDDEEPLVKLLTENLAALGYVPVGFTSSVAALEAFRAHPERYDAVITDERMPSLPGSELLREIRGISPTIPTLLVGGYVGADLLRRAEQAGADEVLRKPLSLHDLAAALARRFSGDTPAGTKPSG